METVTISPKYRVVLPEAARAALGLKAGQKMIIFAYDSRVVLAPERPIREGRGSLKSKDTTIEREEDRL
jgi:AbrB family looped-hinge helix DNA binding protein